EEFAAGGVALRLGGIVGGRGAFSQGRPVPFSFPAIVSIRQIASNHSTRPAIGAYGAGSGLLLAEKRVAKFGIGHPVPRLEAPRFSPGRRRSVDDIDMPLQCYGVLVMSPHAHARIKGIDTKAAKAAPGVLVVLTGADAEADKIGSLVPIMPEDMGGPKGY